MFVSKKRLQTLTLSKTRLIARQIHQPSAANIIPGLTICCHLPTAHNHKPNTDLYFSKIKCTHESLLPWETFTQILFFFYALLFLN